MADITYRASKHHGRVDVLLDGWVVGYIAQVPAGWKYYPKGSAGGEVYATLEAVKRSLESDE